MKKFLSVWLAFCILILQYGCTTQRTVPINEAQEKHKNKTTLLLHTPNSRYQLINYKFTAETLQGNLDEYSGNNLNILHVYTDQSFNYNPYEENLQAIIIPISKISEIKYGKFDGIKTFLIVGGLIAIIIVAGSTISFNVLSGDI